MQLILNIDNYICRLECDWRNLPNPLIEAYVYCTLSLDAPVSPTCCMSLLGTIKPPAFPDLFHFLWDPSRVPSCLAVSPSSIRAVCRLVLPVKE